MLFNSLPELCIMIVKGQGIKICELTVDKCFCLLALLFELMKSYLLLCFFPFFGFFFLLSFWGVDGRSRLIHC